MILISISGFFSQAPEAINYQAIVRDGAGLVLPNQSVGIQISILQGSATGTTVYQETFTPTTNTFGLVNMQIGTGAVQTGAFNTIDWGNGPFFIETAVDVTGGSNYVTISTTQFMSVPYALHAKTVDTTYLNNAINTISTDNQNITGSSINGMDLIIGIENGTSDTVDLSSLTDADADSTNEIQTLSLSNDTLYLSDGNGVYLGNLSGSASSSNNHGYINLISDSSIIFLNNTLVEITMKGGNGGDGGDRCNNNHTGGDGGSGIGIRVLLNIVAGDTLNLKLGINGADGCNCCVVNNSCADSGADGQDGTDAILSINDSNFSSPILTAGGGSGGQGAYLAWMGSCTVVSISSGSNGTLQTGPSYNNSGCFVFETLGGGGGTTVRW